MSTYKPTPLPLQLILSHLHPSSTPLFHSCYLSRNRQPTLSIIWFKLWSRSCSYHRTKENFQRNISNYPLNSKSFHNHRYLLFYLKIIYNQPTVKIPSLNNEDLSNYLSIANLSFIAKLTEKIVKKAPFDHLTFNSLLNSFQSAYTKFYSTLYRDYTTFPTWPSF